MNKTYSIIYRLLAGFLCVFCALPPLIAQDEALPEIYYSYPRELKIADIAVEGEGIDNYDDYVLIGLSGLSVGQIIRVPGSETSEAVKRFWRHGLFSDVKMQRNMAPHCSQPPAPNFENQLQWDEEIRD